jgi:hypothetical protein
MWWRRSTERRKQAEPVPGKWEQETGTHDAFCHRRKMDLREKTAQRAIRCPCKEPKRGHKLDMPLVEFEPAIPMFENWGLRSDDGYSAKIRKIKGAFARFSLDLASKHPAENQNARTKFPVYELNYQAGELTFLCQNHAEFFSFETNGPDANNTTYARGVTPVFVWIQQLSSNSEVVSCTFHIN